MRLKERRGCARERRTEYHLRRENERGKETCGRVWLKDDVVAYGKGEEVGLETGVVRWRRGV